MHTQTRNANHHHHSTHKSHTYNNNGFNRLPSDYLTLQQKIAENLLLHVDGKLKVHRKPNQANIGFTTNLNGGNLENVNGENKVSSPASIKPKINLAHYNFAPNYQFNDDEEPDKSTIQMDAEPSNQQQTPSSTTVNSNIKKLSESTIFKDGIVSLDSIADLKPGSSVFRCNVCGEITLNLSAFEEHELNNHPLVSCTYTEIHHNQSIPVNLFNWNNVSPVGLLKSCRVPVLNCSPTEPSIRCTKCQSKFFTASELRKHILDCSSSTEPEAISSSSIFPSPVLSSSKSASSSSTASSTTEPISPPSTSPSSPSYPPQPPPPPPPSTTVHSTTSDILTSDLSSVVSTPKAHQQLTKNSTITATGTINTGKNVARKKVKRSDSRELDLIALSYNTRSSRKRKVNGDLDAEEGKGANVYKNNGLGATRKRVRRVLYTCPDCNGSFTHHLTFSKHRNLCTSKSSSETVESTRRRPKAPK